jgi:hypothetical protein
MLAIYTSIVQGDLSTQGREMKALLNVGAANGGNGGAKGNGAKAGAEDFKASDMDAFKEGA